MLAGRRLKRAYVNNGGDIALHLTPGTRFRVGVVTDIERPALSGHIEICEATAVRGIATSGRGGRSLSMGIADAVTTLAETAADADAAATMIANSIDLDHRAVKRRPASAIDETSDLGSLPVVVAEGRIIGALLALKGGIRAVGELGRLRLGQER